MKKKIEPKPEATKVSLSAPLVSDLATYLASRPLAEVLPLFQRLVVESRGQLPAPAAPEAPAA